MSEFPKSFQFRGDPSDVIKFDSIDAQPRCKWGIPWSYRDATNSYRSTWIPIATPVATAVDPAPITIHADELTALRRFHSTVMQATQTESNSRLPQAIFAADAEVRRVTTSETN